MKIVVDRAINILSAVAGIVDNLICIATLGNVCTAYEMRILAIKHKFVQKGKRK